MTLAIASRNSQLTIPSDSLLAASSNGSLDAGARSLSSDVITHAWRIYFDFGGNPKYDPPPDPSKPVSAGRVTYSGRHDGLAIYLARLLRPFWNQKLTRKVAVKPGAEGGNPTEKQESNLKIKVLVDAQRDLSSLQTFLVQKSSLFGFSEASRDSSTGGKVSFSEGEQLALREEKESFDNLLSLIDRCLEAIGFLILLIDYQLPNIVLKCSPPIQTSLSNLTFSDLAVTETGRDVARGLAEAFIDAQVAAQVNIDAVAEVTQQRCGSFCSADDVRLYKAMEYIRRAREATTGTERTNYLIASLRLARRATGQMAFDKLENICKQYREMRFAQGE